MVDTQIHIGIDEHGLAKHNPGTLKPDSAHHEVHPYEGLVLRTPHCLFHPLCRCDARDLAPQCFINRTGIMSAVVV